MITEQELALANIRFLAKADEGAEYYDMLRARLSIQEEAWASQHLSVDELFILDAKKRRILWEIDYLQSNARHAAMAAAAAPELTLANMDASKEEKPQPEADSAEPAGMSP
ncbi:hypothetical protein ACFW0P_00040 [Lysobacter soli]|uniref:hypothetical protein n=1 Tax=Lysobacter soli TaxID=453783 RepID=UPI0036A4B181